MFPEPVALVNVIPVEEVSVVAMIVEACRLLEPVALVKVMPVEETVPPCMVKAPEPLALVNVIPVEDTTLVTINVPVKVAPVDE